MLDTTTAILLQTRHGATALGHHHMRRAGAGAVGQLLVKTRRAGGGRTARRGSAPPSQWPPPGAPPSAPAPAQHRQSASQVSTERAHSLSRTRAEPRAAGSHVFPLNRLLRTRRIEAVTQRSGPPPGAPASSLRPLGLQRTARQLRRCSLRWRPKAGRRAQPRVSPSPPEEVRRESERGPSQQRQAAHRAGLQAIETGVTAAQRNAAQRTAELRGEHAGREIKN